MTNIHPTAIIHSGAEIGSNVSIGPFSFIDEQVRINDNTVIGPHVIVYRYTSIGQESSIHAHAVLGDLPQDTSFQDIKSYVRIGSNCIIREGVTIHRGTKPETTTEVGTNCFLMVNSHLAHNVKLGNHVTIANGALLAGYAEVGDRAFISGNCVIHQFVRIGRLAMLSGGCGIGKDVPPFCTTKNYDINIVVGLNVIGMRRVGISPKERQIIKQVFHVLYKSGLNVTQAVTRIRQEHTSKFALEICSFIEGSERGICKFEKEK